MLTEKFNGKTAYYENGEGEIVAKVCSKCSEVKPIDEFYKDKSGTGKRKADCKTCNVQYRESNRERLVEYGRKYRENNKEQVSESARKFRENNKEKVAKMQREWYRTNRKHALENNRNWREDNKERMTELQREWSRNNRDKVALKDQRRRARKSLLPDTLTSDQYAQTLEYFGYACALTGDKVNIEVEHAIPLSTGHCGTTFENCYPLSKSLNSSKCDSNIFEWYHANKERFKLDQFRFDKLIAYLADINGMTIAEYERYYYDCFESERKRSVNSDE